MLILYFIIYKYIYIINNNKIYNENFKYLYNNKDINNFLIKMKK